MRYERLFCGYFAHQLLLQVLPALTVPVVGLPLLLPAPAEPVAGQPEQPLLLPAPAVPVAGLPLLLPAR